MARFPIAAKTKVGTKMESNLCVWGDKTSDTYRKARRGYFGMGMELWGPRIENHLSDLI